MDVVATSNGLPDVSLEGVDEAIATLFVDFVGGEARTLLRLPFTIREERVDASTRSEECDADSPCHGSDLDDVDRVDAVQADVSVGVDPQTVKTKPGGYHAGFTLSLVGVSLEGAGAFGDYVESKCHAGEGSSVLVVGHREADLADGV